MQPKEFLKKLGLKTKNPGTWTGLESVPGSRRYIDSHSPVDGEFIGSVGITTREQYDTAIAAAQSAFQTWRELPAPKRGEIVRQFGDVLRQYKDPLGRLVSYEMGKSLQEGFGEVQEMIDICDFAVGSFPPIVRPHHALRTPGAPHVRTMAPAGGCRYYFCLQFPGSRLVLERLPRLGLRRCVRMETLRKNAALLHCLPDFIPESIESQ